MKCCLCICSIDRDADMAEKLIDASLCSINSAQYELGLNTHIFIFTRKSDILTQQAWSKIPNTELVIMDEYTIDYASTSCLNIPKRHVRHSMTNIAKARQKALDIASSRSYDGVWFLDSDILPRPDTLIRLWNATTNTQWKIVGAPYRVRWCGFPAVAILHNVPQKPLFTKGIHPEEGEFLMNELESRVQIINTNSLVDEISTVYILGFGCTLLRYEAFGIPVEVKQIMQGNKLYEGEDIGYCVNAENKLSLGILKYHEVPHYFDRLK